MKKTRSPKRVPVIGVTGAIGSGKSTVAKLFVSWGGALVSGDEIGHMVVARSPRLRRKLARVFGGDIIQGSRVDRGLLARRAFQDETSVRALNRIVHPELIKELNRQVKVARSSGRARAVVIDAALLVEWGLGRIKWDYLVGVAAPYRVRMKRLRARGLSAAQIRRFSRAQMPWNRKRARCDATVKNDSTVNALRDRARLCWEKLLS